MYEFQGQCIVYFPLPVVVIQNSKNAIQKRYFHQVAKEKHGLKKILGFHQGLLVLLNLAMLYT